MEAPNRPILIMHHKFLWITIMMLLLTGCLHKPDAFQWTQPATEHKSSVSELWSQKNIFMSQSSNTQLIAIMNKVIFIGSQVSNGYPAVIALDAISGIKVWVYEGRDVIALAAAGENVYIGEVGSVTAINSESGDVLWSTLLPFSKSVTNLVVQDGIVYVDAVGANHYLLDMEMGAVLQTIPYTLNEDWNPNLPVWSDHMMNLELSDNARYFQKQTWLYPNGDVVEITALDKLGGKIWSTTAPAISRLSANSSGAYVLTLIGKLVKLSLSDGFSTDLLEFAPSPVLTSTLENGDVVGHGYYVAVSEEMLYVYLGDSAQLFAYNLPITP